jgi:hypothetical protein
MAEMTMVERVVREMGRYSVVNLTDGTIGIEDLRKCSLVRIGLTAEDEPSDICDQMNACGIIEAMREPIEAMLDASGRALGGYNLKHGSAADVRKCCYQAMIDAVLKP